MAPVPWSTFAILLLLACGILDGARVEQKTSQPDARAGTVTRAPFGTMPDGTAVEAFTLRNRAGVELRAITYGAIITSLGVPNRDGVFADVVLGFDTLAPYLERHPYFGAVVGRYGNRIGNAQFTLDGRTYKLAANDGPNHLHGGVKGFDRYVWQARQTNPAPGAVGVTFSRTSPAGEEGYPGTVQVDVMYTLTEYNKVIIEYEARTDAPTPINLTQHTYFNLAGHDAGDVLGHELVIAADRYTPVDKALIPTGEIAPVAGTPLDFQKLTKIGARIAADMEQLRFGRGYDHNWVLTRRNTDGLQTAAIVHEPRSGRMLEVATTEPGVQFYSGNFLDGTLKGKGGAVYRQRGGFCLETQHFPDSPNKPQFPSTILRPGETYRSRTEWLFPAIAKRPQ
jgi:aldose 1-epimerase